MHKARLVLTVLASAGVLLFQTTAAGALPQRDVSAKASRQDDDDDSKDASEDSDVLPVRVVILVDESGSLEDPDVKAEQDAVKILVDTVEEDWEVAIFPFGSDNGSRPAVDTTCGFQKVENDADRAALRACADRIRRRTPAEGNDTDHAEALLQAVNALTAAEGEALPVILLMTDGTLDVPRSTLNYGDNPNEGARKKIDETILPNARKNNVQVWPIGFGKADESALTKLAEGGAQRNLRCPNTAGEAPKPVVKPDRNQLELAIQTIFASAVCASSTGRVVQVPAGQTVDEIHSISPLATSGVLSVVKSNPKSTVAFIDPDGKEIKTDGEDGPSTYKLRSTDRSEVLEMEDPNPGDWTVKVTASAGQDTMAVFSRWTGEVGVTVDVSPPYLAPGQQATATLQLITPKGRTVPPEALEGFKFSGELVGDGFKPVEFKLDSVPGANLQYTGTFKTPKECSGKASFQGSVSAPGLASADRAATISCDKAKSSVNAVIELEDVPDGGVVTAGSKLTGRVEISNSGDAFDGQLSIVNQSEGAQLSIDPSSIKAPAGKDNPEFALTVAEDSRLGQTTFKIVLKNGDEVIESSPQALVVESPPSILPKILALIGLVLLIAGVAAFLVWRRKQAQLKARLVKGLQVILIEDGEERQASSAPSGKKSVFPFKVTELGTRAARENDPDAYLIRRHPQSPKSKVIVRQPDGNEVEVAIGQTLNLDEQADDGDSYSGSSSRRLKIVDKR